ncbi:hypothetical protein [Streptomyces parvus]|uniref:hypothetical protein n=1 Tax=Streptomyces parvus TaxID=66428 RepID=UPI0033C837E0
MGDLANTVAKLEEEAAESRELRSIVERLDTEISFRMETVQEVGGELLELHGSLDDQIAEHDYMAVEQSAASVRGLVDVETVLPAIDAVLLLTALRDDGAIPDLTLPLASFADDSWDHPDSHRATWTASSKPRWSEPRSSGRRFGAISSGRTRTSGTRTGSSTGPRPSWRPSRSGRHEPEPTS